MAPEIQDLPRKYGRRASYAVRDQPPGSGWENAWGIMMIWILLAGFAVISGLLIFLIYAVHFYFTSLREDQERRTLYVLQYVFGSVHPEEARGALKRFNDFLKLALDGKIPHLREEDWTPPVDYYDRRKEHAADIAERESFLG